VLQLCGYKDQLPEDADVWFWGSELFDKLDQWGFDTIVIPHGNTWGLYSPLGTSWDKQLTLSMNDPAKQKMNTEMMSLYREKGVNPASGCIPILLTFPILFAFYSVFVQGLGAFAFDDYRWERLYQRPAEPGHPELWRVGDSPKC
jgi:hypothetical protein